MASTIPGAWTALTSPRQSTFPAIPTPPRTTTPFDTDTTTYIHRHLQKRRESYIAPQTVKIKVGSWNVGNFTDACCRDLKEWFAVPPPIWEKRRSKGGKGGKGTAIGEEKEEEEEEEEEEEGYADVYVLGLQEVVDVNQTQTFLKYMDPKVALNWKAHAQAALPNGYECIASPQLIGMLLLVFTSPTLMKSSVSVSTVGTGLMGYVGNKGGVGVRLVIGETLRLAFVNVHLAAFINAVDRRNWDAAEILRRMGFEGVEKEVVGLEEDDAEPEKSLTPGEGLDKADVAIWCGDLNYRVDLDNGDIRRLLAPYMPKDLPPTHDISVVSSPVLGPGESPSLPPVPSEAHPDAATTLEGTVESLLRHDQLLKVRAERKAWAGFKEGKIAFLPTYKYDPGTQGVWDSSEKARAPSWCDRVLWKMKGAADELEPDEKKEGDDGDTRMRSDSVVSLAKSETLFEAGDSDDDDDEDDDDLVVSRAETPLPHGNGPGRKNIDGHAARSVDKPQFDSPLSVLPTPFGQVVLTQLSYVSYQSITSSDHKPVASTFSIKFPAVVLELRKAVHAEIAREVDKLENERRPAVTLIIDPPDEEEEEEKGDGPGEKEENLIDFGRVRFWERKERHLTIANTGTTVASVSFLSRPGPTGDDILCKPWLNIMFTSANSSTLVPPSQGTTLQPGESCHITLTLSITSSSSVTSLNASKETLDDVLILHTTNGRDSFLPITGRWFPSSFGTPLQELIRIPDNKGGFRAWHQAGRKDSGAVYSAPRELYRLTEFILKKVKACVRVLGPEEVLETKAWYATLGWPFIPHLPPPPPQPQPQPQSTPLPPHDEDAQRELEAEIWNSLDTDMPFPDTPSTADASLASAATSVLLHWLRALPTAIIPDALWQDVQKDRAGEQVLDLLPPVHANVFVFFAGWVGECVGVLCEKREDKNKAVKEEVMSKVVGVVAREIVRRPEEAGGDGEGGGGGGGGGSGAGAVGKKQRDEEDRRREKWVRAFVEM